MPTPPGDNLPVPRLRRRSPDEDRLAKLKKYLLHREQGLLFFAACRAAGLHPSTVTTYRSRHPDFAEAERVAWAEGVEKVEVKLQERAESGDIQAISKFLEANDPDKYSKQATEGKVLVVHVDATNALTAIAKLKEELMRRQSDIPDRLVGKNPFLREDPDDLPTVTDDEIVDAEVVDEA